MSEELHAMVGERPALPAVYHQTQESGYYFQLGYHEWFYGPFATPTDVGLAMRQLDAYDSWWDYDGVRLLRGVAMMTPAERAEVVQARGREGWK